MLKALIAIDGSDHSLAAVRHVVNLISERGPLDIHLLNVRAPLQGDVTAFVDAGAMRDAANPVTLVKRSPAARDP